MASAIIAYRCSLDSEWSASCIYVRALAVASINAQLARIKSAGKEGSTSTVLGWPSLSSPPTSSVSFPSCEPGERRQSRLASYGWDLLAQTSRQPFVFILKELEIKPQKKIENQSLYRPEIKEQTANWVTRRRQEEHLAIHFLGISYSRTHISPCNAQHEPAFSGIFL